MRILVFEYLFVCANFVLAGYFNSSVFRCYLWLKKEKVVGERSFIIFLNRLR